MASGCKDRIRAGVVLTGGASLIEGCQQLAEQVFDIPCRIGYPRNIGGLTDVVDNPKFATAVGLLRYGAEQELRRGFTMIERPTLSTESEEEQPSGEGSLFSRLLTRMKRWTLRSLIFPQPRRLGENTHGAFRQKHSIGHFK